MAAEVPPAEVEVAEAAPAEAAPVVEAAVAAPAEAPAAAAPEAAPAPAVVNTLHGELAAGVEHAVKLAIKLLDHFVSVEDVREDRVLPHEIAEVEALAFMEVKKGGFVITKAKGHGFLIKNLGKGKAWSPPVFFDIKQWGAGFTFGAETIDSVAVLKSPDHINKLCAGESSQIGYDLIVGSVGGGGTSTNAFGQVTKLETFRDKIYSITGDIGMQINLAVNSTEFSPDKPLNTALYTTAPRLEDVLAGKVPTFTEMVPLYEKLAAISRINA